MNSAQVAKDVFIIHGIVTTSIDICAEEKKKVCEIKTRNGFIGILISISSLIICIAKNQIEGSYIETGSLIWFIMLAMPIVLIISSIKYSANHSFDINNYKSELLSKKNEAMMFDTMDNNIRAYYNKQIKDKNIIVSDDHLNNNLNKIWINEMKDFCVLEDYDKYYIRMKKQIDELKNLEPISYFKVPYENILYYATEGNVQYSTSISGGGGGGYSIPKAIVGDLIAGPTGAIILGKNEIEPISSSPVKHDDRKTVLFYKAGDGVTTYSVGGLWFYDYLLKKIPEKDWNYLNLYSNNNNSTNVSESIVSRLTQLNKLLEQGMLSEDEYSLKRDEIIRDL